MLLVSTFSNVQARFVQLEALINGINDDKSMIMLCVDPPSWNMHTEGDVRAWDTSIYKYVGHIWRTMKDWGIMCILRTPRPIYRFTYRPHIGRVSVDISAVARPICRSIYGRHIARLSADISVDIAADTRPIRWPLIIGGILVDCRWSIGRLSYNISQKFRLTLSDVYNLLQKKRQKKGILNDAFN